MSDYKCQICKDAFFVPGVPAVDKDGNEQETFKACECLKQKIKRGADAAANKFKNKKKWWEE
jgi:hypothetical protein